jgi:hypothetical protein
MVTLPDAASRQHRQIKKAMMSDLHFIEPVRGQ